MKFLKTLRALREANTAAAQTSREVLEAADRSTTHIDRSHEHALMRLKQATEQADKLTEADNRNHYSESLTLAFRGRTA
jgi:hypothetical protein